MQYKTIEELTPFERAKLAAMKKYYGNNVSEEELLRALTYQQLEDSE
jgi:hypothetical protein